MWVDNKANNMTYQRVMMKQTLLDSGFDPIAVEQLFTDAHVGSQLRQSHEDDESWVEEDDDEDKSEDDEVS